MESNKDDWKSEEEKQLDLELENRTLELNLKLKGGEDFAEEDIDPKLHNAFLKSVETYEELDEEPKRPMKSLFPESCVFHPADRLSKKELKNKLDFIFEILAQNNIQVALPGKLPDEQLYTYLTTDIIPNELTFPPHNTGFCYVIDGCDGYCPECFQKDYCEVKDEIGWDEEDSE